MTNLHQLETKIRQSIPYLIDADKDYILDVKAQMANHGMPLAHIAKSQVVLPTIEITIADLLQYLGEDYAITGSGDVLEDVWGEFVHTYQQLDLSKPLSDQNEAVIEFLLNIK